MDWNWIGGNWYWGGGVAAGVIYKSSARISAGGTALPIKRVATTRPSGNTNFSGRPWRRATSRTCSSRACVCAVVLYVHGAGGRHGGRQAKLVVYARVLGVAAAEGALVQAWGAASQQRPTKSSTGSVRLAALKFIKSE